MALIAHGYWKYYICLLSLFVLSGCWDRMELNDISIVSGIAVEKGDNKKYRLTVSKVNSAEFGQKTALGDAATIIFSEEGNTIAEISRKLNLGVARKLIYSHTRILVIDKEVAEEGLLEFFDFLERSGEIRNDFNILVANNVKASDVLKVTYPFQRDPSMKMSKQIESFVEEWGGDPNIRLSDFLMSIVSKGREPVCATVTIRGNPEIGSKAENNKKIDLEAILLIDGMAIFEQDKLKGIVNTEEARNYLWTQDIKETSVSVPCDHKENKRDKKNYDNFRIVSTKAKIETKYANKKPVITVRIGGEGRVFEMQCPRNIEDISGYIELEKSLNQHVEREVFKTITTVQKKYGVDIFGFGEAFNRQHHKLFKKFEKNWNEQFQKAEIIVKTNLKVRRSGIRTNSYLNELNRANSDENEG